MEINLPLLFRTDSVLCSVLVQPVYGFMVLCTLGQVTVIVLKGCNYYTLCLQGMNEYKCTEVIKYNKQENYEDPYPKNYL